MTPEEKQSVIKRYQDRYQEFGNDLKTLGWGKGRDRLRYRVLMEHWNLDGESVLDFGCGFGNLIHYCRDWNLNVHYEGLDIVPELIKEARKTHPETTFHLVDALYEDFDNHYDVIVASGLYSLKLTDSPGFIRKTFDFFANHAKRGFAVNFMSDRVDFREDHLHYANPEAMLELGFEYSHRVALRHDYMPFEFSLFVDLKTGTDSHYNVFSEFTSLI